MGVGTEVTEEYREIFMSDLQWMGVRQPGFTSVLGDALLCDPGQVTSLLFASGFPLLAKEFESS